MQKKIAILITELELIFSEVGSLKEPDINCPDMGHIEVDSWFDQIQFSKKSLSLQKILSQLEQTNQYQLAINKRLYLLDKLHSPVISLIGSLKPDFLNTLMPLNHNQNQQVDLCLCVYHQIIRAYSIILQEQIIKKNKTWLFHHSLDSKITLVIQRLVRYLSQIILSEFEVYRQPNKETWEKLYTLYIFSDKNNYVDTPIIDPVINKQTTIKITFIQILLLALSDPYHFNPQQIYYIYKHLAYWASLVKIAVNIKSEATNYTKINLGNDLMPTFFPRGKAPDQEQALFIDTQKLTLQTLHKDNGLNNVYLSPKIKTALLTKINTSWSVHIDRTYQRNDYCSELKAVIGLNNVHYVLNNYQKPDWIKNAEYTSKNASNGSSESGQTFNSVTFKSTMSDNPNALNTTNNFITENESLNGLSLLWAHDSQLNIKIGEIIALSHEQKEKPENWFIGLIRSIQHYNQQPLKIGVQLLCPSGAVPIAIKQQNQFNFHRGLLLPEFSLSNKKTCEPESILADALTFNPADIVEVESCDTKQQKRIQMNALLLKETEITQFYMRFLFNKDIV